MVKKTINPQKIKIRKNKKMCNLNIFIKTKEEKDKKNFINFFTTATTNSFINNKDGEGIYFSYSDNLIKSKNKISIFNQLEDIQKSSFIISHQRLATHGLTYKYTQPFNSEDFIFLHNGILNNFVGKNKKSDSFNFFQDFLKEFCLLEKNNKKTREKNILNCLKLLLNKTNGSYSIGLFDKKQEVFYYVKNKITDINFFRNQEKDFIYITTRRENSDFLEIYSNNFKEFNIEDYKVYRIYLNNKKVLIKPLIEIKQEKDINIYSGSYGTPKIKKKKQSFYFSKYKKHKLKPFFKNIVKQHGTQIHFFDDFKYFLDVCGFFSGVNKRKCNICGVNTKNKHQDFNIVYCDSCINDNLEIILNNHQNKIKQELISYT